MGFDVVDLREQQQKERINEIKRNIRNSYPSRNGLKIPETISIVIRHRIWYDKDISYFQEGIIMSTKEVAYSIIDGMTEEMRGFVSHYIDFSSVPNQETLDALEELRYMEKHLEEYKSYDNVDTMFEELLNG